MNSSSLSVDTPRTHIHVGVRHHIVPFGGVNKVFKTVCFLVKWSATDDLLSKQTSRCNIIYMTCAHIWHTTPEKKSMDYALFNGCVLLLQSFIFPSPLVQDFTQQISNNINPCYLLTLIAEPTALYSDIIYSTNT